MSEPAGGAAVPASMSAHPPPVPPEQRPPHGSPHAAPERHGEPPSRTRDTNTAEQGEAGNMRENTTNTGYQQDR